MGSMVGILSDTSGGNNAEHGAYDAGYKFLRYNMP